MRGNHSFIGMLIGAAGALLLAACATVEKAPLPPPVPAEPIAAPEPDPAPETTQLPDPPPAEPPVALREEAPLRYVVQRGDTLWDISQKFLRDSWQWPELWYANPDVRNPHLIYPGDVLYLYWAGGRPRLAREGDPVPTDATPPPPDLPPPANVAKMQPQVRERPLGEAISGIPLDAIRAFLRAPRVVSRAQIKSAPYVVGFEEDRLALGNDSVAYVLNLEDRSITHWQVVRVGEEYRDPEDDDVIGYEARPVADSEVRVWGDPATIFLRRSDIETRVGDLLLPAERNELPTAFYPKAPAQKVNGRIISVYDGLSQIGQYQVVAINRGSETGLEPGHVLDVWRTGRKAKDPLSFFGSKVQLPDINAGQIMVFKVAERLSYALVMNALREIHILDRVETPDPEAR